MARHNPNDPFNQGSGDRSQYSKYAGSQAMSDGFGQSMFAADAAVSERVTFIRNTYLHLCGAVLLFALLEGLVINYVAPAVGIEKIMSMFGGYNMLFLLGGFMAASYLATACANSNSSRAVQYAGLGIYVLAETVIFMPILLIASNFYPGAIEGAAVATVAIFGGLTLFTFVTRIDFSFMRQFLFICSMAALAMIVASIFMGMSLGVWFSGAMVLLMAGYILYQTSNIMNVYQTDQHVAASLALFASVATMFFYILRIIMATRE